MPDHVIRCRIADLTWLANCRNSHYGTACLEQRTALIGRFLGGCIGRNRPVFEKAANESGEPLGLDRLGENDGIGTSSRQRIGPIAGRHGQHWELSGALLGQLIEQPGAGTVGKIQVDDRQIRLPKPGHVQTRVGAGSENHMLPASFEARLEQLSSVNVALDNEDNIPHIRTFYLYLRGSGLADNRVICPRASRRNTRAGMLHCTRR
jgi:hypothetical protein